MFRVVALSESSCSIDGQPARKFQKLSDDDLENFKLVPKMRLRRGLRRGLRRTRSERFSGNFLRVSLSLISSKSKMSTFQLRRLVKKYHSDFSKNGLSFDPCVFDDVRECAKLVKLDLLDYESRVLRMRESVDCHADFVGMYSDAIDDHTYTEARFRENLAFAEVHLKKYHEWSSSTSVRFSSALEASRPLTGLMLRKVIFGRINHCQSSGKVLRWS